MEQEKPLASWNGEDRLNDEIVKTLTIILKSGGCSWNRCKMCQYRHERYPVMEPEKLSELMSGQLSYVKENCSYDNAPLIKIYTSGSFFDSAEVPGPVLEKTAELFRGKCLIVECRADYVSKEVISEFIAAIDDGTHETPLYVALGLETTSDEIREKSIDKGITFENYKNAVSEVRKAGAGVKTYLLHKPAYLTEREAYDDMKKSISEIENYTDMISMNPCTVQRHTVVERLWRRGAYRPPYLWSVISLLNSAKPFVSCDPVGGGYQRGPHNCKKCDRELVAGIRDYSLTADRELLDSLMDIDCSCKKEWEYVLTHERSYNMPLTS